MKNTPMHNPTSHRLACGKEIRIHASLDEQPTVLQMRQEASPDDPRTQSFTVGTELPTLEGVYR